MILLPDWLTTLFSLMMGLVVGSFLNVVIARVPLKRSIVRPGSRCPGCQKAIRWYDNFPVLSWLVLRGKCRNCGMAISVRYPVIELMTALLFVATKAKFGFSYLLLAHDWPFVSLLVAITFIDLEHRIIPDVLSLGGLALGLLTSWLVPEVGLVSSITGAALGFSIFFVLAVAYQKF